MPGNRISFFGVFRGLNGYGRPSMSFSLMKPFLINVKWQNSKSQSQNKYNNCSGESIDR